MSETVASDERMALGVPSEIATDSARSFAPADATLPAEEFSPAGSNSQMLAAMRAAEMPAEVVRGALTWVQHGTERPQAELDALDAADIAAARETLQQLWEGKYATKLQAVNRYLSGLPPQAREVIAGARDPATGRAYANDPAVMVRLAGLASRPQPEAGGDEIAAIEKFMRTNRGDYNRDEALQAKYRQLLDARNAD